MKNLRNITLEMSLKPFKKTDQSTINQVCHTVFEQWKPLIKNVQCISILLWTADGSELLDYRGNLDDKFEWAYWIGCANPDFASHTEGYCEDGLKSFEKCYPYIDNPPVMTYSILKQIVSAIKITGKEMFPSKEIKVGTTIDPGPEFALSDFKYNRHNEICSGSDLGKNSFICAYTKLNGDDVSYAGFPNGIPDGTPFGTFFGKQANVFMHDMDFDFIWMSNGLGFGRDPWSTTGAIFDGTTFNIQALKEVKDDVLKFWELFRAECPDYPIHVRGTNNSLAIDYATDGVPLKDIYDNVTGLLPPPNSPWAALTHNYGFELMGYMSRIAYIPNNEYMFRFYIHDPWWSNSPWYDRYFCQPHDIYLPLSIGRIDENGKIGTPTHLSFLTIDNSFGDLPDSCVYEPLPHLMQAFKEVPDDVSPIVWVYPVNECSTVENPDYITDMYYGDHFIMHAINAGLPLSSVTTTDSFIIQDKSIYDAGILVSPIPLAGSNYEKAIISYCSNGGKVLFYGNVKLASSQFKDMFELSHSDENCDMLYKNFNSVLIPNVKVRNKIKTQVDKFLHTALSHLGIDIIFENDKGVKPPTISVHRYNNGYFLSAYSPSSTVKTKIKTPLGAPVFNGCDTKLDDGYATYFFPKAEHKECRVFVEQANGIIICRDDPPISINNRRYIEVLGLENATIRFFAEDYCKKDISAMLNFCNSYDDGTPILGEYITIGNSTFFEAKNITGNILFSMPKK